MTDQSESNTEPSVDGYEADLASLREGLGGIEWQIPLELPGLPTMVVQCHEAVPSNVRPVYFLQDEGPELAYGSYHRTHDALRHSIEKAVGPAVSIDSSEGDTGESADGEISDDGSEESTDDTAEVETQQAGLAAFAGGESA